MSTTTERTLAEISEAYTAGREAARYLNRALDIFHAEHALGVDEEACEAYTASLIDAELRGRTAHDDSLRTRQRERLVARLAAAMARAFYAE